MFSEEWDDGNSINNDGCSSAWEIEQNFICSGGSVNNKDTWYTIWGNGFRSGSEEWDDGGLTNYDGWSSEWKVEEGFSWSGGSSTQKDTCVTSNVAKDNTYIYIIGIVLAAVVCSTVFCFFGIVTGHLWARRKLNKIHPTKGKTQKLLFFNYNAIFSIFILMLEEKI